MVQDDGASLLGDIAKRLNVDSNYAGQYRLRLIALELIAPAGTDACSSRSPTCATTYASTPPHSGCLHIPADRPVNAPRSFCIRRRGQVLSQHLTMAGRHPRAALEVIRIVTTLGDRLARCNNAAPGLLPCNSRLHVGGALDPECLVEGSGLVRFRGRGMRVELAQPVSEQRLAARRVKASPEFRPSDVRLVERLDSLFGIRDDPARFERCSCAGRVESPLCELLCSLRTCPRRTRPRRKRAYEREGGVYLDRLREQPGALGDRERPVERLLGSVQLSSVAQCECESAERGVTDLWSAELLCLRMRPEEPPARVLPRQRRWPRIVSNRQSLPTSPSRSASSVPAWIARSAVAHSQLWSVTCARAAWSSICAGTSPIRSASSNACE
jgi:hypothetical protein